MVTSAQQEQAAGMTDDPRHLPEIEPYPGQPHEGRPESGGRPRAVLVAVAIATGILLAGGVLVGAGYALLWGLNPMGDEWVCSQGEAPAGAGGPGGACYPEGSTLPPGVHWDPFGNRPMPYNCDKDGWVLIERTVTRHGGTDVEQDCVREGTDLPGAWHLADD
jgi:hypothetical protein